MRSSLHAPVTSSLARRAGRLLPSRAATDRAMAALYRGQHLGLALLTGPLLRAVQRAMRPGRRPSPPVAQARALVRRFRALLDDDLENARAGVYPRSLLFQVPLGEYARRLPEGLLDLPRFLGRVRGGRFDDLPPVDRARYPRYYLRNFHFQTDGWLSPRSARLYDLSVELLFGGTADVMRRMALPPVIDAGRALAASPARRPLRVLDLACGTGRFLGHLRRVLPGARLAGVDLSPAYAAHARARLEGSGAVVVEGNAEALPFPDGAFDVVTVQFLLHELPPDARRNVLREAHRVLASPGRIVVLDAEQLASGAEIEHFLQVFPRYYHEPYFAGFLRDDLVPLLQECGFTGARARSHLVSQVAVGEKGARGAASSPPSTGRG